MTAKTIPSFESEADEARWWDEHADDLMPDFEAALADGSLQRGTLARRFHLESNAVEVPTEDAQMARAQAAKEGVGYEAYVQTVLHEALMTRAS